MEYVQVIIINIEADLEVLNSKHTRDAYHKNEHYSLWRHDIIIKADVIKNIVVHQHVHYKFHTLQKV